MNTSYIKALLAAVALKKKYQQEEGFRRSQVRHNNALGYYVEIVMDPQKAFPVDGYASVHARAAASVT